MKKTIVFALLAKLAVIIMTTVPIVNIVSAAGVSLQSGPLVMIRLPERFRVLTDQQFDLRIEASHLTSLNATIKVFLDGSDITNDSHRYITELCMHRPVEPRTFRAMALS
ncbi:MAG TPA: hypothetical protein VNN73_17600 [Blastocatellia bacterium]|nr:hypothetical protein [Blastocatellia bacterium]